MRFPSENTLQINGLPYSIDETEKIRLLWNFSKLKTDADWKDRTSSPIQSPDIHSPDVYRSEK